MPGPPRKLKTPASAAAALLVAFLAAYAGDAGHGFIKDDFRWIRETEVATLTDAIRLFERSDGFYRPIVSLTFAANRAAFGIAPRAYGLVNLALAVGCAALVYRLGRRAALPAAAAVVAAGVWAFNFHGINMAVLWISGRTGLLVTLFALLAGIAFLSGRGFLAAGWCLLAMLSKEEAVLLPVVGATWAAFDTDGTTRERIRAVVRVSAPSFAALAAYAALRLRTEAFWPGDAPSYYRLTFSPAVLSGNALQYVDRAVTTAGIVALALFAASRGRARLDAGERRAVILGAAWLALTFAITVFVPARSSLYAVLPSAGAALAAGAVAAASRRAAPKGAGRALVALTLLPLLLLPVYWRRNDRWVQLADVSSRVLQQVRITAREHPGRPIVLVDEPSDRFNLDAAFGTLWPDAAALCLPPDLRATIAPHGSQPAGAVRLRLAAGRLVREQ